MRHALGAQEGKRLRYTATFKREGTKRAFKGPPLPTVLLVHVRDASGREVADHLWFNRTKGFFDLSLKPGDVIEFDGRVKSYEKGYKGRREDVYDAPIEEDFKLSHPTRIAKVASGIPIDHPAMIHDRSLAKDNAWRAAVHGGWSHKES